MKHGAFPKASAEKAALLDELASGFDAQKRKMFGAPVYFVAGNMWAGVFGDGIFLRLPEQDRTILAEEGRARPFVPMEGRSMKEYVELGDAILEDRKAAMTLFETGFAYCLGLKKK